jgi:hypothetical protein
MKNPIRIRIGTPNAGDAVTQTYTDSTFAEAVAVLQGTHDDDYHRDETVYVVATWPEDTFVPAQGRGRRDVTYKAGEPLFGFAATIYGRGLSFGEMKDAQPSWASMGTCPVEEAELQVDIIQLAIQIAKAANSQPHCPGCVAEFQRRQDREARMLSGPFVPVEVEE